MDRINRSVLRQRLATTAKYVYLTLIGFTTFFPLSWTFSNSFSDNCAIFNVFWSNYVAGWAFLPSTWWPGDFRRSTS